MAIDITPAKVRDIFTTRLTDSQLGVFCEAATDLVVDKFTSSGLSDPRVERIGLFLAAHFASANSPVLQSERTGPHQWTRQGETGMGLDSTYYGQMAKTLDTTGVLGNLGTRIATVGVIGKPEE